MTALVVGIIFLSSSCQNDIKVVQEMGEENNGPFQTIYDASYIYSDSGRIRNRLEAAVVEQFTIDTNLTRVSGGFKLELYDRDESISGILYADSGLYFEKKQDMEAFNDVIFTNTKGDSLFTEHLIWKNDSHIIFTREPVRIIKGGTQILGKGLRANEDFSRYTILAPIGDIAIPESAQADEHKEDQ